MKVKTMHLIVGAIICLVIVGIVAIGVVNSNNLPRTTPSTTPSPDWGQFPEAPATAYTTDAIFQLFERGFMIWRQDKNCVYSVETATERAVLPFTDYPNSSYGYCLSVAPLEELAVHITPPSGLRLPTGVLGKVWSYYAEIQTGLGFAIQVEQPYTATILVDTGIKYTMDGSPFYRDQIILPDGHTLACGTRAATAGTCNIA